MASRRSLFRVFVPVGLCLLVVALAVLQYRWLGRVSDAERQELGASLERRSQEFADDVDHELGALQRAALDASTSGELPASLSAKLNAWRSSSRFAGLVRATYVAQQGQGAFVLQRLDEASQALEPVEWPSALAPVRERLALVPANVASPRSGPTALPQFIAFDGPSVVADVPALIVWLPERVPYELGVRLDGPQEVEPDRLFTMGPSARAAIVQLDREFIVTRMLPALIEQHFGLDRFRVQVIDGAGTVLLSRGVPASQTMAETRVDITKAFLSARSSVRTEVRADRLMTWTAATSPEIVPPGADTRFALRIERQEFTPAPVRVIALRDRWRLLVQHQAGSLDLAVTQARHFNLYLSFGILSVLVATMGLVLVTARRSERLAAQQMDFVATVSHELRTPVTVIRAAAENLSAGLVDDPAQAKRYGDLIEAESRRLTDMVEQVLEHAGVNAAKRPVLLTELNLSQIARESAGACAPIAARAGCVVDVTLDAAVPFVRADEASLRRAIENLIVNAIKHAGSGHWVGVTTRVVVGGEGPAVEIEVADRGPGIDAADRPHIFEPFYRGRAAIDGQVHGSGLGLSLVKQTMDAIGALVRVEDRPDGGAAFVIRLRALDEPARVSLSSD